MSGPRTVVLTRQTTVLDFGFAHEKHARLGFGKLERIKAHVGGQKAELGALFLRVLVKADKLVHVEGRQTGRLGRSRLRGKSGGRAQSGGENGKRKEILHDERGLRRFLIILDFVMGWNRGRIDQENATSQLRELTKEHAY